MQPEDVVEEQIFFARAYLGVAESTSLKISTAELSLLKSDKNS